MKKYFISLVIISALGFSVQPKEAQAFVVFESGTNLFTNIATTAESIWNTAAQEILLPAVERMIERELEKVVNKSLNLGGELLVTDLDQALRGTGYAALANRFNSANNYYYRTLSESGICARDQAGCSLNPTEQAEQNYRLMEDGSINSKRSVASTISKVATKSLFSNALDRVIKSDQKLIKNEDFNQSNFWGNYLEIINPERTEVGVSGVVTGSLSAEVTTSRGNFLRDLQTPQRFLDQKRCIEYEVDDITGEQVCVRNVTLTPGAQIAEKVNESILKDERVAGSAEGLVGMLISSAIGKVTDDLISKGIAGISGRLSGGSNNQGNINNSVFNSSGLGRSEFDVLGNSVDSFQDNSTRIYDDFQVDGSTGGGASIGGPEDGNSVQITIDLSEVIEENIRFAEEEQSYFDEIQSIRNRSKETIIALDQCLPSPQYGWEERFSDIFQTSGTSDYSLLNSIALSETRQMVNDPWVNIPGASDIRQSIDGVISETKQDQAQNAQRISAVRETLSTLRFIKDQVVSDAATLAASNSSFQNLVMFDDQWSKLGVPGQTNAFNSAISNNYYSLKTGETASSIINERNSFARDIVKTRSWDIWRENTEKTKKNDLRYSFFVIQNKLSNEEFVTRARVLKNQIGSKSEFSESLLQDCFVFRAYSLGASQANIQQTINSSNNVDELIANFNKLLAPYQNISYNGFKQDLTFINTDTARDDDEIGEFINDEYQKQLRGVSSLFKTTTITGALPTSILGFANESDKEEYFEENYPIDDFKDPISFNQMSVKEMLRADRFISTYGRARGIRGVLFCRVKGVWDAGADNRSICLLDWYKTSNLDYNVAFAGI